MLASRLQVTVAMAKIEFSGTSAAVDIRQPLPRFTQSVQQGRLEVSSSHPRLQIDASVCQSEEGHKPVTELTYDYARQGAEDARESMRQINSDAQAMIDAGPYDRNIISERAMAKIKSEPDLASLIFIPSQPPGIDFTPNEFHMEYVPTQSSIHWEVSSLADIQLAHKASLDIRMAQYPEVDVALVPAGILDVTA